jgi:hypothetical protein
MKMMVGFNFIFYFWIWSLSMIFNAAEILDFDCQRLGSGYRTFNHLRRGLKLTGFRTAFPAQIITGPYSAVVPTAKWLKS